MALSGVGWTGPVSSSPSGFPHMAFKSGIVNVKFSGFLPILAKSGNYVPSASYREENSKNYTGN